MYMVIKNGFNIPAPATGITLIVSLHKRQLRPKVPDQPLPPNVDVGVDIPPTLFCINTTYFVQSTRFTDAEEGRHFY